MALKHYWFSARYGKTCSMILLDSFGAFFMGFLQPHLCHEVAKALQPEPTALPKTEVKTAAGLKRDD